MEIADDAKANIQQKLLELRSELDQAKLLKHRDLLAQFKLFEEKSADEREKIEIYYEISKKRIENEYERRLATNKIRLEKKQAENRENMLKELEEAERQANLEYSNSEIGKANLFVLDTSKKTLRGRGGGVLIEPPTYFNATPKPSTPQILPSTNFLLSDAEIAADVRAIALACDQASPIRNNIYEVNLNKQRLTYDGKTYKQSEDVMVENMEYGKLSAKIDLITEVVVIFKATQSWDVRQIHASYSDLAEGRVQISKKRNA